MLLVFFTISVIMTLSKFIEKKPKKITTILYFFSVKNFLKFSGSISTL